MLTLPTSVQQYRQLLTLAGSSTSSSGRMTSARSPKGEAELTKDLLDKAYKFLRLIHAGHNGPAAYQCPQAYQGPEFSLKVIG